MDRIDRDGDGFVTQPELKDWIKHTQNRYIYESVNKNWKDYDKDNDGQITWNELKSTAYGHYEGKRVGEKGKNHVYVGERERCYAGGQESRRYCSHLA